MMERPAPEEYHEYYRPYVALVPDGPILVTLERQLTDTLALLGGLDEERATHRYEPGKWSVKEVVGHLVDIERLFAFRALWFARRDPGEQPGMEQDDWVAAAGFDRRTLAELLAELRAVRRATLTLFHGFTEEDALREGIASGRRFTVRSLAWIAAGHELHHRGVLAERYLSS
ncbi:MAG: DinB family protein [Thermoanaerobaculia bacterium]|nr:DinB family protein [Thermoanaerobaculia bacterium]